ncbi:hypothetical protein K8R30_04965 [archaeon]|nr:hypothetical protein [archaeon]
MNTYISPVLGFSTIAGIIIIIIFGFIKSKGWENKERFIMVPAMIAFSILFIAFIVGFWNYLGLEKPADSIYQLSIILLFIIAYLLLGETLIDIVKWKKEKDFLKVEGGLVSGLYGGLIGGLIGAIAIEYPTKPGSIFDTLILCQIISLPIGYLIGATFGLILEFRD